VIINRQEFVLENNKVSLKEDITYKVYYTKDGLLRIITTRDLKEYNRLKRKLSIAQWDDPKCRTVSFHCKTFPFQYYQHLNSTCDIYKYFRIIGDTARQIPYQYLYLFKWRYNIQNYLVHNIQDVVDTLTAMGFLVSISKPFVTVKYDSNRWNKGIHFYASSVHQSLIVSMPDHWRIPLNVRYIKYREYDRIPNIRQIIEMWDGKNSSFNVEQFIHEARNIKDSNHIINQVHIQMAYLYGYMHTPRFIEKFGNSHTPQIYSTQVKRLAIDIRDISEYVVDSFVVQLIKDGWKLTYDEYHIYQRYDGILNGGVNAYLGEYLFIEY